MNENASITRKMHQYDAGQKEHAFGAERARHPVETGLGLASLQSSDTPLGTSNPLKVHSNPLRIDTNQLSTTSIAKQSII